VSAQHAQQAEVRLYEQLFTVENPDISEDVKSIINPHSLRSTYRLPGRTITGSCQTRDKFQFERVGYFCMDPDSLPGKPVFNRTVTLKDTWAKIGRNKVKNNMPIFNYIFAALAAVAAGFINAMAGGGTLITFPVLMAIGLPAVTAMLPTPWHSCPVIWVGQWPNPKTCKASRKALDAHSCRSSRGVGGRHSITADG